MKKKYNPEDLKEYMETYAQLGDFNLLCQLHKGWAGLKSEYLKDLLRRADKIPEELRTDQYQSIYLKLIKNLEIEKEFEKDWPKSWKKGFRTVEDYLKK